MLQKRFMPKTRNTKGTAKNLRLLPCNVDLYEIRLLLDVVNDLKANICQYCLPKCPDCLRTLFTTSAVSCRPT